MEDHIRVAIRVRPLSGKEALEQATECVLLSGDQINIGEKSFTFDHVFGKHTSQEEIYKKCVSTMVDSFFTGYNTTIFAYGQTGTGKTFTMGTADNISETSNVGIIPRVVEDIFARMYELKAKAATQGLEKVFSTKVAYLEIYNEAVKDLLHPDIPSKNIVVREDAEGGIIVMGLKEEAVHTKEELHDYMLNGNLQRTTGATLMNDSSSRSHSIFTIIMEQKQRLADGSCAPESFMISKFHLVDLAGSERAKKTGAIGQRLKESVNINSGLLALGNVISALGDTQRKTPVLHVPYRESKLTRLLQDSLGGNSKTLMIACVSPADTSIEESLNTLRYANRARNIHNKPIVNRDPHLALLAQLRSELQACRMLLLKHNIPLDDVTGVPLALPPDIEGLETDADSPAAQMIQQLQAQNDALATEVTQLQSERKQHCCLDVLASDGEDLFSSLLEAIAEIADESARTRLTNLIADMQQRAIAVLPKPEPLIDRRTTVGRPPKPTEPAKRSTSKGATTTPRPRSTSAAQPAASSRRVSLKRRDGPDPESDEVKLESLQTEYAKLQAHADRLKEDLFQAEWRTVELDSELQQERTELLRLREEVQELKRTNWKLNRRPPVKEGGETASPAGAAAASPLQCAPGTGHGDQADGVDCPPQERQHRPTDAQAAYEANCVAWEADMERMQRERDELAQLIGGITNEKQRLEDQCRQLEQLYLQKQDYHQQNLRSLADTIQAKEQTIRELAMREEEAEEMCRRYERRLVAIEEEKHQLQLELMNTLSVLEKANMDAVKKERHRQQLLQEYDMKLKAAEANAQEQRRRLKEKEQQLKQQRQEEAQLRKLRAELAQLREQQDRMKQKVRQEADRAEAAKANGAQQVGALRKQLADLERKNRDAEVEKKQKEDELATLRSQMNKEKSRAELEKEQLQTRLDKEQQQNHDLERRNRALDRRVELSRKRSEVAEKLQREQLRREQLLRERAECVARRDQLQQQLKEHDWAFSRGLSGWAARVKTLEAELVKRRAMLAKAVAAQNAEKAATLQEAIAKLLGELETTQAKHDHLRSAMTDKTDLVFQRNMAAQIGGVTEVIEDLDEALAFSERQIRDAEEELRVLAAALRDEGDADDAEIEAITRVAAPTARANRAAALPPSPRVPALRAVGRYSPNGSPESLVGSEGADSACTGDSEGKKARPTPDGTMVDYKAMLGKYHAMIVDLKTKEGRREHDLRELEVAKQEDRETITKLENVIKMMEISHRRQLGRLQEQLHKSELQRAMEDQLESV